MDKNYIDFISGNDRTRIVPESSKNEVLMKFFTLPKEIRDSIRTFLVTTLPPTRLTDESARTLS